MELEPEDSDESRAILLDPQQQKPVYIDYIYAAIFTLFGLTMLSPWNTLIQLTDYFKQRLQNSAFAGNFEGYITATFQVVNILSLFLFLSFPHSITQKTRLYTGFVLVIISFLLIALISFWTELHPTPYFLINLVFISLASFASACLGQIVGLASNYPWYAIIAVNSGQGLSGLFPSLIQLFDQKTKGSITTDSILLKLVANMLYCLLSIATYSVLLNISHSAPKDDQTESELLPHESNAQSYVQGNQDSHFGNISRIFSVIKLSVISVYLNMAITLSIFPALTAYVAPQTPFPNFVLWHFVTYSLCDWIGKSISLLPRFVLKKPQTVFILTLARLLFIPLILVCNIVLVDHDSKQYLPVLINDQWYFVVIALFAFSNGWLTTSCFIQAPIISQALSRDDNRTVLITSDLMALGLALGLASGGICTFMFIGLACQCNPF